MSLSLSNLIRSAAALLCAAFMAGPAQGVMWINSYVFTVSYASQDALEIITALGETANLQFCLDAGDATSYDGSSQVWNDLTANDQNFNRGTTAAATTSDPTFNGSSGALTTAEYFSFDGGDTFSYDSANEAWMITLHKNNAAGTFIVWYYADTLGATQALVGDIGAFGTGTGFSFNVNAAANPQWHVRTAGTIDLVVSSTSAVTENAWNFVAASIDESIGAGGLIFNVNGTADTADSTYTTPTTNAPSFGLNLGSQGDLTNTLPATSRMAMVCAWSRALTSDSLTAIYNATNDRGF
jgi:hypothetical protein